VAACQICRLPWTLIVRNDLLSGNQTEDQKAEDFRDEMPLPTESFHSAHSAMCSAGPWSDQGPTVRDIHRTIVLPTSICRQQHLI
jgi:hypothetical protein